MRFLEKIFAKRSNQREDLGTGNRKVLLALPWLPVSGVETLYSGRIKDMSGTQFTVVTTRDPMPNMGDRTQAFESIGCRVEHLPNLAKTDEERSKLFIDLVERGKFSHLIIVGCTMAYDLLPEIKGRHPEIDVIDELWDDGKHMKKNQALNGFIDTTIVPSETIAAQLRQGLNEIKTKIVVIPCGIAIPSASERAQALAFGKRQLPDAAKGKFVVSFLARLSPEKNALFFVRIVERLRDVSDCFFCLVGDGPEKAEVIKLIDELDLHSRIYVSGFVEKVDPLVAASDVLVVPSVTDGQPLIVLHALAHSKPVIASNVGQIPTMVIDGVNGYLVKSGDLDGFSAKIADLCKRPDLAKQLGTRGFEICTSTFDEKVINKQFVQLFEGKNGSGTDLPLHSDKVLFVFPWLPVGGFQTLFTALIKALTAGLPV